MTARPSSNRSKSQWYLWVLALLTHLHLAVADDPLLAGTGRADITDRTSIRVNDPLYAKALALRSGPSTLVFVTVDAVAIGTIGRIRNDFLPNLRARLKQEFHLSPSNLVINASHCHGAVREDVELLTFQAIREALQHLVPVHAGAGTGREDRISENRRIRMKDGSEIDMRRAYALPRDEDIAALGPIDPEIGLLRLDREDGTPLAVLYNFACHPILNPPNKGNSADFPGFASRLIEESLGHGAMAFFVQGCGGDINPIRYKSIQQPPDAEPLGLKLGLSVLSALKSIKPTPTPPLVVVNESLSLPRAQDFERRIAAIDAEQKQLLQSLKPTDINFRSFVPLYLQQRLWPDSPSFYRQGYLRDQAGGADDWVRLDTENRRSVEAYLENIQVLEQLTRLNVNRALLRQHLAESRSAPAEPLLAELIGIRIGQFRLITFPGELTVQIGLKLKKRAPHPHSFIAGYSNGYLYYLPTAEQRNNTGYAQEDCDSLIAPEWQSLFESKALEVLGKLQ